MYEKNNILPLFKSISPSSSKAVINSFDSISYIPIRSFISLFNIKYIGKLIIFLSEYVYFSFPIAISTSFPSISILYILEL